METFAPAPRPRPRCRIEHRTARGIEVLSHHPDDLDDLTAYLAAEGGGGVLVVVEEATGRDIVRRAIPGRPGAADGEGVSANSRARVRVWVAVARPARPGLGWAARRASP